MLSAGKPPGWIIKFQSAPGREAGRCSPRFPNKAGRNSFNPRPAVRPGDASGIASLDVAIAEFQSAPGREAGRCI